MLKQGMTVKSLSFVLLISVLPKAILSEVASLFIQNPTQDKITIMEQGT